MRREFSSYGAALFATAQPAPGGARFPTGLTVTVLPTTLLGQKAMMPPIRLKWDVLPLTVLPLPAIMPALAQQGPPLELVVLPLTVPPVPTVMPFMPLESACTFST